MQTFEYAKMRKGINSLFRAKNKKPYEHKFRGRIKLEYRKMNFKKNGQKTCITHVPRWRRIIFISGTFNISQSAQ